MPNTTIYLPEDLHEAVKSRGIRVSPVCQTALRKEIHLMDTITTDDITVEVVDPRTENNVDVVFVGTWLVEPDDYSTRAGADGGEYWGVALTARRRVAVWVGHVNQGGRRLEDYDDLDGAIAGGLPDDIAVAATEALQAITDPDAPPTPRRLDI